MELLLRQVPGQCERSSSNFNGCHQMVSKVKLQKVPRFTQKVIHVPLDDEKPMAEDGQSTKNSSGVGEYSINPDGSPYTRKQYVGT